MSDTLTLVERTMFLKSVDLLAGIPTEPLATLAARATEVHVQAGEVLFRDGDEDRGTFLVIEGEIELRREGVEVRVLGPRATHGELFLGATGTHQYTGVARRESRALNLDRADVFDALSEYPEFGLAMVKAQALLIHKLTERVLQLEARLERGGGPPADSRDMPALEVPVEPPAADASDDPAPTRAAKPR